MDCAEEISAILDLGGGEFLFFGFNNESKNKIFSKNWEKMTTVYKGFIYWRYRHRNESWKFQQDAKNQVRFAVIAKNLECEMGKIISKNRLKLVSLQNPTTDNKRSSFVEVEVIVVLLSCSANQFSIRPNISA